MSYISSMLPDMSSITQMADGFVESISRGGEELKNRVMKVSESARLVKSATNNQHWGPTGPQMRKIADLTFQYQESTDIMLALWERLAITGGVGSNWRNVYKALLLLDYVIKNGSEAAVNDARMNIHQLKGLMMVHYVDPEGVDRGLSIRERAKIIVDLLSDTNRLRDERKKSKLNRDKYGTAYSSTQGWRNSSTMGNSGVEEINIEDEYFSGPSAGERGEKWDDDGGESKWNDFDDNEDDDFQFRPGQSVRNRESASSVVNAPTTQSEWDPFGIASGGAKEDDWADWSAVKEKPAQANNWNSNPAIFPPTPAPSIFGQPYQTPTVSPPIVDLVSSVSTLELHNPEPALVSTPSTVPDMLKTTPQTPSNPLISPVKPNDPWAAHSHLFDLTLSNKDNSAPSPGKTLGTSGKTLGSTIGPGWGSNQYPATQTTGTFPGGYVVTSTYPAGYMTGYTTGGVYPPTGVYPQSTRI